jgi:uncharacterized alpha/beta hydrolase family protein
MSKKNNYPFVVQVLRKTYPFLEILGLYKSIAHRYFFKPLHYPFPESEKEWLNKAIKEDLAYKNETIKTYQWGNLESVNKVLLVHGWSGRATQFRGILEALEKDFHLISFDSPAHGLSTGESTTMIDMAEIMATLVKKYTIKYAIGHSLGGAACVYSKVYFDLNIEKMVLISAPSNANNMLDDFILKINGGTKTKKYIRAQVVHHFKKELDDFFALEVIKSKQFCKTLAIHDLNDSDVRFENLAIFKQLIQDITVYTSNGLGHTKILRDENVIAQLKNFLSNAGETK